MHEKLGVHATQDRIENRTSMCCVKALFLPFEIDSSLIPHLVKPYGKGSLKFKENSIKCLLSWNSKSGTKENPCHAWIWMDITSIEVELKKSKWYHWIYSSNPLSSERVVLNSCCKCGHSSWLKSSSIPSTTPHCTKSDTWSSSILSSSNHAGGSQFTSWFSWRPSLKIKGCPGSSLKCVLLQPKASFI